MCIHSLVPKLSWDIDIFIFPAKFCFASQLLCWLLGFSHILFNLIYRKWMLGQQKLVSHKVIQYQRSKITMFTKNGCWCWRWTICACRLSHLYHSPFRFNIVDKLMNEIETGVTWWSEFNDWQTAWERFLNCDDCCWQMQTRRVAVYLGTHCNIGSKKAFLTGVLDRWHNCLLICWCTSCLLFSSCIWRYLVSRACDWVISALSTALLIFSFQFSLLFFHMGRQALVALRRIGFNTQYRTLAVAENLGRYLSCTEHTA